MDSRDQFESTGHNFGAYPAGIQQDRSNNFSKEAKSQFSNKAGFAGSNWSGNIMWTFAFGEKETNAMAGSVFSSGRQAWHLLNQMNDLCKTRHGPVLRSSALIVPLASELRAIANDCQEPRFFLELRVTKGGDGSPDLELMDNGRWRKPSLRANAHSEPGTIMVEMGD
jgi:hypothetical protein